MSVTVDIPDLTSEDIQAVFGNMDAFLNKTILNAFCDASPKCLQIGPRQIIMVLAIVCLYIFEVISFSIVWWIVHYAFIRNAWSFWEMFLGLQKMDGFLPTLLVVEIAGATGTIIADILMIWRCWTVWGQRWLIVLLPTLCTIVATGHGTTLYDPYATWVILYLSLVLATNILCTLLIIYRIITVVRADRGGTGIKTYRGAIEILVESAFLYSFALLLYVIFVARETLTAQYLDTLAAVVRGIAPTLVVGRVAAGQARPDDSWSTSVASSLRFGGHSDDHRSGLYSQGSTEEQCTGGPSHDNSWDNADEGIAGSPGDESRHGRDSD
ncbi:uncharacterized protein BT62DRAFT_997020 [Guyanagaster necrorhizus]|uniref:Uncharacterized protein n=1 Tax=Guyanagaster necrorhizus TaxID=856835 RepID=A0A9P7VJM7_9AGAR|nr:uncharacterized protein BT62DRAFT_997020 [Guyanagaster necrorhizus MCA 3950]KAG7441745.1 hypothetical protein BT62DRAFT_997020 [Guyanagaster necrorhizus MCA 3950]